MCIRPLLSLCCSLLLLALSTAGCSGDRQAGEECSAISLEERCAPQLVCDALQRCRPYGGLGQYCNTYLRCRDGLSCVQAVCRSAPPSDDGEGSVR